MPGVSIVDLRSLAAFRYEIRKFVAFTEATAREAGVEPQQQQLLLALIGLPEGSRPTVRTLAERLLLKHHSAVELVRRCVEQGLVTTVHAEDDRRLVLVTATDRGRELLTHVSGANRDELRARRQALIAALSAIGA